MTTFQVHDVAQTRKALPRGDIRQIVYERCGSVQLECISHFRYVPFECSGDWRPLNNAFIAAIHAAFSQHYPLVLTPDAIWLCIVQGLAHHVSAHSEKLRRRFVAHEEEEDKQPVTIKRDDFIKGSPINNWPETFEAFSDEVRRHVGEETHDRLSPNFSTTGPVERAAAQVVLMDCFRQYFCYKMVCICGIPSITLKGTPDDWKLLRQKVVELIGTEMEWWVDALQPILDQFVEAASGKVDRKFWSSIYKLEEAYGESYINGWIVALFPYLHTSGGKSHTRNHHLEQWVDGNYSGHLTSSRFPPGVVSVPFEWHVLDAVYPMHLYVGFMAATQDPKTFAIHAEVGWAVSDAKEVEAAQHELSKRKRKRHRVS